MNETQSHFHVADSPVARAALKATQAPGWKHFWDGIAPQDQVIIQSLHLTWHRAMDFPPSSIEQLCLGSVRCVFPGPQSTKHYNHAAFWRTPKTEQFWGWGSKGSWEDKWKFMEIKSHFWRIKMQLSVQSVIQSAQLKLDFVLSTEQDPEEFSRLWVFLFLPTKSMGETRGKGPAQSSEREE